MRKVRFLEMLAKGQFVSNTPFLSDVEEKYIPLYPFADLLEPVEYYDQGVINTSKGKRYNFPQLQDIGDMATIRITGDMANSHLPAAVVRRYYWWRGIRVSAIQEGAFIKVKRIG